MTRDRIVEPRNKRSRRTREALLASAREILEQRGFEDLSLADVAKHAGVTRMTAYLHFASRGDLVVALFDHSAETEGLDESLAKVWNADDAVSALDEWASHLARFEPKVVAIRRAIDGACLVDPDVAALRERVVAVQLSTCRRIIRWVAGEGRLRSEWTRQSATDMLFALMSADLLDALMVDRRWSTKRLADHLALTFRSTFVADDRGGQA